MNTNTLPRERLDGRIIGDVIDFFAWELEMASPDNDTPTNDFLPPDDDDYDPEGEDEGSEGAFGGSDAFFSVIVAILGIAAIALGLLFGLPPLMAVI